MANKIGRKTVIEFEAEMNKISTEINVTIRGGVPEAMIDLGDMCIPGNLVANILITFNTLILILLGYKIASSLGIIRVRKMWTMMRCPFRITS